MLYVTWVHLNWATFSHWHDWIHNTINRIYCTVMGLYILFSLVCFVGQCHLQCNHHAITQFPALRPDPYHYPSVDEPLPSSKPSWVTDPCSCHWPAASFRMRMCVYVDLKIRTECVNSCVLYFNFGTFYGNWNSHNFKVKMHSSYLKTQHNSCIVYMILLIS